MLDLVERLVLAPPKVCLDVLCSGLAGTLDADWVAVLSMEPMAVKASHGELPDTAWLTAFVEGARFDHDSEAAPHDVAWAHSDGLSLAIGRARWGLRQSERVHLKQLARIAARLVA